SENTVRNYVNYLREHYHIPKVTLTRIYGAVNELPPGQQMQVDFGEIMVDTSSGGRQKLYVAGFILSHSRFKYVEWLARPFRTQDLIRIQGNAFQYFGGMTEEIVYDQDRLLAVSENAGDLILTESFTQYQRFRRFRIELCRKSDPESKGKIEQVIKYIKNNFARHRIFDNLSTWQQAALRWLKRTGNYKVHHNIKKRPFEVHALEKPHLQTVRENIAYVAVTDNELSISLQPDSPPIAHHPLSETKGQVVTDPGHRQRSQTKRDQRIAQVYAALDDTELATWLVDTLQRQYPRHLVDQLKIVLKSAKQYPQHINDAVQE